MLLLCPSSIVTIVAGALSRLTAQSASFASGGLGTPCWKPTVSSGLESVGQ